MFDNESANAYEAVYEALVARLKEADLEANAMALALEVRGGRPLVPLFNQRFLVDSAGVSALDGPLPSVACRIVLARYLLHGGGGEPAGTFVPYRDLPGGMDFARNLAVTVEGRLSRSFAGKVASLKTAATTIGGHPFDPGTSCDAAFTFPALPGIRLRLTFYDADEDFPAETKVLYDANSLQFLDLECLAVLGVLLAEALEADLGPSGE